MDKIYCGNITFQNQVYEVYLDSVTKLVWVNNTEVKDFGIGNLGNLKAETEKEALNNAAIMLRNTFGNGN